jgi:hypothetical protein
MVFLSLRGRREFKSIQPLFDNLKQAQHAFMRRIRTESKEGQQQKKEWQDQVKSFARWKHVSSVPDCG